MIYNSHVAVSLFPTHLHRVGNIERLSYELHLSTKAYEIEFAAFVFEDSKGQQEFFMYSGDRGTVPAHPRQYQLIAERIAAGWKFKAHLHNHPFLFDQDDVGGIPAPSTPDVQLLHRLHRDYGLQELWVTNGFHTLKLTPKEAQRMHSSF